MSKVWRSIFVFLAICLGILIYQGYSAIRFSLEAEKTLHATNLAINVVHKYVKKHGQWPASWNALLEIDEEPHIFKWPGDLVEIQKRVFIDFAIDPKKFDIAKTNDDQAIKSLGPHYPTAHVYNNGFVPAIKNWLKVRDNEKQGDIQ